MIKKNIASLLVILIFINSIGCYNFVNLPRENLEEIENGDRIIVIKNDFSKHDIRVLNIDGTDIHGMEWKGERKIRVKIPVEEVRIIEVKKLDKGKTILFGILGITGIIVIISIIAFSEWTESSYGLDKMSN